MPRKRTRPGQAEPRFETLVRSLATPTGGSRLRRLLARLLGGLLGGLLGNLLSLLLSSHRSVLVLGLGWDRGGRYTAKRTRA